MPNNSNELPLSWRKVQVLSGLIASTLVPVVIGLTGHGISQSVKEGEIRLKYIQLSLDILQSPPQDGTSNIRQWAIKTLNYYSVQSSGIPLEEAEDDLEQEPIDISGSVSVYSGSRGTLAGFTDGKYCPVKGVAGIHVIGIDHTLSSKELQTGKIKIRDQLVPFENCITVRQAEELFDQDLEAHRKHVDRLVEVELTKNQREALAILSFNIGYPAFAQSTLLKKLNQGDYDSVPSELRRWSRAAGPSGQSQVIPGLIQRREREIKLWMQK